MSTSDTILHSPTSFVSMSDTFLRSFSNVFSLEQYDNLSVAALTAMAAVAALL